MVSKKQLNRLYDPNNNLIFKINRLKRFYALDIHREFSTSLNHIDTTTSNQKFKIFNTKRNCQTLPSATVFSKSLIAFSSSIFVLLGFELEPSFLTMFVVFCLKITSISIMQMENKNYSDIIWQLWALSLPFWSF